MNLKNILVFFTLLFSFTAFSIEISETVDSCSQKSLKNMHQELSDLRNYHLIDGSGYKKGPVTTLDMTQSTPIKNHPGVYLIALRPVPGQVNSLPKKLYPHFYFSCKRQDIKNNQFAMDCKSLKNQDKFVVSSLTLNLVFSNSEQKTAHCPSSANKTNISTYIKNDLGTRYPETLVNFVIDTMISARKFFKDYWRFFLIQWM